MFIGRETLQEIVKQIIFKLLIKIKTLANKVGPTTKWVLSEKIDIEIRLNKMLVQHPVLQ